MSFRRWVLLDMCQIPTVRNVPVFWLHWGRAYGYIKLNQVTDFLGEKRVGESNKLLETLSAGSLFHVCIIIHREIQCRFCLLTLNLYHISFFFFGTA